MKTNLVWVFFISLSLSGCIGDDIIFDTVEEAVRIVSKVDTLGIGDSYQFEAMYTNNIGAEEDVDINWSSSDESIITITNSGLATGIKAGSAVVKASYEVGAKTASDEFAVIVDQNTVVGEAEARKGKLRTTSSYRLQGDFTLEEKNGDLILTLADNYEASSSLPGLYIYLTNNPSTNNGALEIGEVKVFKGTHSFTISGDQAMLNQYSHVLYYCKPFRVKVGDGAFEN